MSLRWKHPSFHTKFYNLSQGRRHSPFCMIHKRGVIRVLHNYTANGFSTDTKRWQNMLLPFVFQLIQASRDIPLCSSVFWVWDFLFPMIILCLPTAEVIFFFFYREKNQQNKIKDSFSIQAVCNVLNSLVLQQQSAN